MTKDQWTIKTLEEEAVNSDSPEATKEKGIQEHTVITEVAYIFALIEEERKTLMLRLDRNINLCCDYMLRSHVAIRCPFFSWISRFCC